MKKYFILIVVFCASQNMHSQEVYLYTGKNFTNYVYKNSSGNSNLNLQSGIGSFYEIGYSKLLKNKKFNYTIGLTLNEYNALGGNTTNSYSWNTAYLGIQILVIYEILNTKGISIGVKGGINLSSIIYGKQEINETFYDLMSQKDFSGLLLQPIIGLQGKYNVTKNSYLSLGYNFSKSYNLFNNSTEKLSFNTSQIQFGIHFSCK